VNIGDLVEITECHAHPELVGQEGKVIGLMAPEKAKHPVAVAIMSGEHTGKLCGFREDELKLLLKGDEGIPPAFLEDK